MAKIEIEQILVLRDNYIYLLHDRHSGATAAVDPAESEPVLARLEARGWRLTHILNTHHHDDHTGGNLALQAATGCQVVGAAADAGRIPGLDRGIGDGDFVRLGEATAKVLAVPGHTLGHLAYWFSDSKALFCGDTLFSLGCGRLLGGSAEQMWASLSHLRSLPDDSLVYCAHEYTEANARFARQYDGDNPALLRRIAEVETLRARQQPTIPALLEQEKAANPFLRADRPELAHAIGLPAGSDAVTVFAELRRRKDLF